MQDHLEAGLAGFGDDAQVAIKALVTALVVFRMQLKKQVQSVTAS